MAFLVRVYILVGDFIIGTKFYNYDGTADVADSKSVCL